MARHNRPTFALGLLGTGTGVVVLVIALYLGSYVMATPRAIVDSAKGHQIAVPAVVALVAGVVTLAGRRRGWALGVGCVAAAAAVVAVLMTVLIPDGS